MNQAPPPGWYPDPAQRFEGRYWDGFQWTNYALFQNQTVHDPLVANLPPVPSATQTATSVQATMLTHPAAAPTELSTSGTPATAAATKAAEPPSSAARTAAQAVSLAALSAVSALSPQESAAPSAAHFSAPARTVPPQSSKGTLPPQRLRSADIPAPRESGWHPDPDTGGTRYSNGTRWTGDLRPPRRAFAAPSSTMPFQYLLPFFFILMGLLFFMAGTETGSFLGFYVLLIITIASIPLFIWMARGKGPTTSDVLQRLAEEEKQARTARIKSNLATFVNGFKRRSANDIPGAQGEAAQIKALSDPQTAKALQNLQNLLYTRALTEEEFQIAKQRLIGVGNALDQSEQILQLAELYRQGILGDLEYASAKARILKI